MKAIEKKIFNRIALSTIYVIVALLMIFVLYFAYCHLSGKVAFIGKYATIEIVSQSMEPKIPVGEYILVEKCDVDQLENGDVIVFTSRDPEIYGSLNTHRIIDITESDGVLEFTTKGDNNPIKDTLKTVSDDVVGKYVKNIPVITSVANFFNHKAVFFLLVLIPSLGLMMLSITDFMKKAKEVRMEALVAEEVERLKTLKHAKSSKDKTNDIILKHCAENNCTQSKLSLKNLLKGKHHKKYKHDR